MIGQIQCYEVIPVYWEFGQRSEIAVSTSTSTGRVGVTCQSETCDIRIQV